MHGHLPVFSNNGRSAIYVEISQGKQWGNVVHFDLGRVKSTCSLFTDEVYLPVSGLATRTVKPQFRQTIFLVIVLDFPGCRVEPAESVVSAKPYYTRGIYFYSVNTIAGKAIGGAKCFQCLPFGAHE